MQPTTWHHVPIHRPRLRRRHARPAALLVLAILGALLPVGARGRALGSARPVGSAGDPHAVAATERFGAADALRRDLTAPAGGAMAPGFGASSPGAGLAVPPPSGLVAESARGSEPPSVYADAGSIRFSNGIAFDPLGAGPPNLPETLTSGPLAPGATGSYLVQLTGPVAPGQREQLEAAGATVFSYVPRYTFVVRMNASAKSAVQTLGFVRWVGTYQPAYKLSGRPELAAAAGPQVLAMLLFPDASVTGTRFTIEAMGGTVLEATDSGWNKILRVSIDMSHLAVIASLDGVAWVEPWFQRTVENNICQWVNQTFVSNNRRIWDMGLHGEGQVIHSADSGIRTSHYAFRDTNVPITTWGQYPTHRKVIAYIAGGAGRLFGDASGASYHGTHTAGTMVGDDSPFANDARDGHALKAKIYFTDVGDNSTSVFPPADLNLLFDPPYQGNAGGAARITSNSWGSPVPQYDIQAMTVDQFMWNHRDFVAFFSNGNQAGPGTAGSPAVNKDGLGIGATMNGANAGIKASFSSEGPTVDGRRKPTIMAPGDGVTTPLSGISSANGANDTGYQSLAGTSMACPAAAGAAVLIRQYCTDGWYPTGAPVAGNGFIPSGALLKAMAISSTDNDMTAQQIPNSTVGWGRIKLDNVLYFPGDAARTALIDDPNGLATGEFVDYEIHVTDASVPLKVTLCWTDKEGNPSAATQLVNDLDLTATAPNGTIYIGNVFAGGQSAVGGAKDPLNVEEGVRLNTPMPGTWKVRVSAANVPFGPQPFAIAVTGKVGNVSGVVRLDRQIYGRSDQMVVRVEDVNAVAPVTVALASGTETTPQVVTLAGANGVYSATVPTTAFAAAAGDGKLSVSNGDVITATYTDANPAGAVTASAHAAFDGPIITGVSASESGGASRVSWSTDVLATGRVTYGTTPSLGQSTALASGLTATHGVTISGLLPQTEYYFDVESADHGGNTTRDDNGGAHYRFATGTNGQILVVIGDGTFGRDTTYRDALASKGWGVSFLSGGVITNPPLGNRGAGMRSHAAVWWQVGLEQYPPFEDAARESLAAYLGGGGRLAVSGHDIVWAFTDPASGHQTPARTDWLHNTLHASFIEDPAGGWAAMQGIAGDPISDAYQGGVPYAPHRQGASGDELQYLAGSGTASYIWTNTDATPDHIGFRWTDGAPNGDPATAVWGGTPSRLLFNGFEWSGIVSPLDRADILDKSLIWLIGRDHPDVAVTSPNGGATVTADNLSVSWTEASYGGTAIASRSLYYSDDGGVTWHLISNGVPASPYVWNLSGISNGSRYRVRAVAVDDGSPPLSGHDDSDADFTINRPGGDTMGPVVVAGTIRINPNPIDNRASTALTARLTEVGHGGSNLAAAEYSWGPAAAPAGTGFPMNGAFAAPTEDVTVAIPAMRVRTGEQSFWVRGRDAAGNWGPAAAQTFVVNGDAVVGVDRPGVPLAYALERGAPNPARGGATRIAFALPKSSPVDLAVYGVRGERVRTLVSGVQPAGYHTVRWDGRDDAGRAVGSGVFFYQMVAGSFRGAQKLVVLR
jgi:subtilase family protein/flagellar hook capping protein FlgD